MPWILNSVLKPIEISEQEGAAMDADLVYSSHAEAQQAQRDNCPHETKLGNRSTGRVTCADCGELTDELVLVPRGLLGSARAAIRQKLDAPRTLEGLRKASLSQAVAPRSVAAQGITREQLDKLWREINNSCFDHPETPPYVRLAEALSLLPQFADKPPLPFGAGDVGHVGDCGYFAADIDVDDHFSRIQVYGKSESEATALRDYLLACICSDGAYVPPESQKRGGHFYQGWNACRQEIAKHYGITIDPPKRRNARNQEPQA